MRMVMALILVLLSQTPISAQSDKSGSLSVCASISDNSQRLRCYDEMNQPISALPRSTGEWRINVSRDARDGTTRVVMRVENTNDQYINTRPNRVLYFYAACRGSGVSLWFNHPATLEKASNRIDGIARIDGKAELPLEFRVSYDKQSMGLWDDKKARRFLTELRGAQTLTIEAKPKGTPALNVAFNIQQFETAVRPLAKACKWSDMVSS